MTAQIEKREIGNLLLEGIPEIPGELSEKLNQYQNTREAHFVDWINDGAGMLITTRFGEALQFHIVETPGGTRKQITFYNEPVFNGKVRPQHNGFLFSKDVGGNETYQLFYYDLQSGKSTQLSDGYSKNSAALWKKDGSAFVFTSTRRNQKDHDLYIYDFETSTSKRLLEVEGLWHPVDWSPDGRYLSIINYRSANESPLFVLDVKHGELRRVAGCGAMVACRGGVWDKDGKGIYFTSDTKGEFRQLYYLDVTTDKEHLLTADLNWDVEQLCLSPEGKQLAFTSNENGIGKLYLLNTDNKQFEKIELLPDGQIGRLRWHPTEHALGMTINTANSPSDAYVLDFEEMQIKRWTKSELGGLRADSFIHPRLMHYATFDSVKNTQRKIPAFYYRPNNGKTKHPVLIYIHGGPESQYRPVFLPIFQYYLNELGIAVIAPNVRGSTGYGKQFLKLDNGYKREDSVKDIGCLLDWIAEQPELDERRVAVIGGSYGGYMVLASMTHFNDRLRCGIDIVGISNFVTFLKNTKSYRRDLRRIEYGDERDPKMRKHLEQISPTTNAHKITKPMLIVQGLNDPRVPVSEAEQMIEAIRNNGGEAWYLLAKDEGHGFRKKSNRDVYSKAVILFLQKYLLS
jgi:dipeptidyl aminopeptidase/acylaminoacyl peptidase